MEDRNQPTKDYLKFAFIGLILGIVGLFAWYIPIFGVPINLLAIIFGAIGLRSRRHWPGIAALTMGTVGIMASIFNWILAATIAMDPIY